MKVNLTNVLVFSLLLTAQGAYAASGKFEVIRETKGIFSYCGNITRLYHAHDVIGDKDFREYDKTIKALNAKIAAKGHLDNLPSMTPELLDKANTKEPRMPGEDAASNLRELAIREEMDACKRELTRWESK